MLKLDRVVNIGSRRPSRSERSAAVAETLRRTEAALESVRVRERSRIARDIHDELGQALTGLKLDLARLSLLYPQCDLRPIVANVEQIIARVRRIATELHPAILDDLGLSAALEWYAREFERRTGIRCGFRRRGDDSGIDADRRTALFRVFQEALTNAARHAAATRVFTVLTIGPAAICLHVRDNGCGIVPNVRPGLGLATMRERAAILGGCATVRCDPGRGTTVAVRVPRAS